MVQAFHLGPDGDTAPQEFALVQNVHEASASVPNAASVMTRERGRAPPAVVHLAVIPPHASRSLHVVAVLADGCRVFFEAMPARRALRARAVMPNDGLAGTAAGLRGGGNVRAVRAAVFASNTLLVVESGTLDSNLSELIATLPNPYCAPPAPYQAAGATVSTHRLPHAATRRHLHAWLLGLPPMSKAAHVCICVVVSCELDRILVCGGPWSIPHGQPQRSLYFLLCTSSASV